MIMLELRLFSNLLEGLRKRGFKLTMGEDGTGFLQMAWKKAGGYYLGTLIRSFNKSSSG
jgi:hypothetical protein